MLHSEPTDISWCLFLSLRLTTITAMSVGSALVGHEHVPNYKWLLQAFGKAHLKPPLMILTDQCPAMKQAIASVFPDSRHRLCIWHIMNKVPNKI
ncbi:MULE transposase domain-containing protein, partial [Cynara cardunculus var. scolymus]